MKWPNSYRGWDHRFKPVTLEPTRGARGTLIAGCIVYGLAFAGWMTVPSANRWLGGAWWLPLHLAAFATIAYAGRHERFDHLVPKRLRLGLCPKCFYQLDKISLEEDNVTICPECGAAWKLQGMDRRTDREATARG